MLFYAPAFIFIFLPLVLGGYFLLGKKRPHLARIWLLGASLVFYSLGTSASPVLLLSSIATNFTLAQAIGDLKRGPGLRKLLLGIGISLNAGLLIYYKCLGLFSLPQSGSGHGYFLDILIPLGLSFFTLQQIAFLVDTYRGRIRETSLLRYALFVSFFPQLIAGPIVRYQEMMPQLTRKQTFRFRYEHLAVGSFIFILGALKKICIADTLAPVANTIFGQAAQGQTVMMLDAWLGSLCFYLQLYFDFSAYSDMAIGVARLFGITLPLNFNSPYQSRNLPEVFLRWHITLYRFLTDYLLIPMMSLMKRILLGSQVFKTRVAVSTAVITTFGLSGLWHGASLNFLLWGLINGVAIIVYNLGRELRLWPRQPRKGNKAVKRVALTFLFCLFAAVIFRCQSLAQAGAMFKAMAGCNGISLPLSVEPLLGKLTSLGITFEPWELGMGNWYERIGHLGLLAFSLLLVFGGPNIYDLTARYTPALKFDRAASRTRQWGWMFRPSRGLAVAMALAAALMIARVIDPAGAGSETFIYFHF